MGTKLDSSDSDRTSESFPLSFGETLTRRNLGESLFLGEKIDGDDDEAAMIVAEELRASMA